ncbi:MAG: aminotransferase class V-fold PLP-dependent enzyme [Sandaracinaceae bacterium]|nr:aminotransferase class V-fold PLP-dependent enzyme [Sandaracinaceae bacterium]
MSSEFVKHWTLDPALIYLNHGSFGACPTEVIAFQNELRARMERNPEQFFMRDLETLLDAAREKLAAYLRADPDELAFVANATVAVNAVVRSLDFRPGDELLTTSHAYNACKNVLDYVAARTGARVVVAEVPFPLTAPDEVVDAIIAATTSKTKLALIDHVTSPTALVFPIARIVAALREREIDTLVDGAHAPGMLDLDVAAIGAAYYTGNCHKWMCAPKGAAFLHVRTDRQKLIRPAVISHGANATRKTRSRFRQEFDWMGTTDVSSILSVPKAIETMSAMLPSAMPGVRAHNRSLALEARSILMSALGLSRAPAPDEMIGSMVALPLPDTDGPAATSYLDPDPLQAKLLRDLNLIVPMPQWPRHPKRLIRISAQLYNARSDYEILARSLS